MRKYIALFIAVIFLVPMAVFGAGFDLTSRTVAATSIIPTSNSGNTPTVGAIIDGLGYKSIMYVINIGTIADNAATFTVLLQHCDNNACSDAATPVATILHGTAASASFTHLKASTVTTLEYAGTRRYTRMTITPASNGQAAMYGVVAIKANPQYLPAQ